MIRKKALRRGENKNMRKSGAKKSCPTEPLLRKGIKLEVSWTKDGFSHGNGHRLRDHLISQANGAERTRSLGSPELKSLAQQNLAQKSKLNQKHYEHDMMSSR